MRAGRIGWIIGFVAASILLTLVAAGAIQYYLTRGCCDRLETRVQNPEVRRALEQWVASNWSGDRIPPEAVLGSDGIIPGRRWLTANFDGAPLGMGSDSHVRLLGVQARDILDDKIAPSVEAIYFAEHSRSGVLVQLPDRPRFSAQPHALSPISENISVFCAW